MSVYVVTGRLGSGKTLLAVSRIRDALRSGRRVATNLDLKVEKLLPAKAGRDSPVTVVRVPDKPSVADLDALGLGSDVLDESKYGLLVLDELAAWLNARQWGDKERQLLIDWLVHSRKRRWDIIFIVQHLNMIDKQIRDALAEYVVTCKRLDKVRVPFFGVIGRILTCGIWDGRVGKVHLGIVAYAAGSSPNSPLIVDRWIYRGHDLYAAYDTEQIFTSKEQSPYSYCTPWEVCGRYLPPALTWRQRVYIWLFGAPRARVPDAQLRPKLPAVLVLMRLPSEKRLAAASRLMMRADGCAAGVMPLRVVGGKSG